MRVRPPYTLAIRNNKVYVACTDTDSFEPEWYTLFWPTTMTVDQAKYFGLKDGQILEGTVGRAVYSAKRDDGYYVRGYGGSILNIHLVNGPQTLPDFTEKGTVPRPKTRVETRWYYGRWQKYLKTKGWVNV